MAVPPSTASVSASARPPGRVERISQMNAVERAFAARLHELRAAMARPTRTESGEKEKCSNYVMNYIVAMHRTDMDYITMLSS